MLFTTNGKEYITPKQLRHEVADEILAHGGRVNVTELPTMLNVDLPHIERALEGLLQEGRDGLRRVGGDLITDYYLDSLAEEVNALLQGCGKLTLAELAVAHTLSTDFVRGVVEGRLGAIIDAKMSGSTLFTAAYVCRHTARVRGVLSAVTRPASLPGLLKRHALDESLFFEDVAELHASGRVAGTLQAKTSLTPAVHKAMQAASVSSFLEQNGAVEYSKLAALNVRDPRAYLLQQHEGGVALASCYMLPPVLASAEAAVEEALSTGAGAIDLRQAFPCAQPSSRLVES